MRTRRTILGLGIIFAGTSCLAMACGSSSFSGDDGLGNGSGDGGPGSVVDPNCDITQLPSQNACVVEEQAGVFVAGPGNGGSDTGIADGTRAHPYATIQKGITTAKDQKKRVYVCLGDYAEQITLADGVSIFGNLDCTQSWKVSPTLHAAVKAGNSPAATANQIQTATRIEGLDVIAAAGSATSKSSIGLVATSSPGLTFANATIESGNGFDGVDGIEGIQLTQTTDGNGGGSGSGGVQEDPNVLPHTDIQSCPGFTRVGQFQSCAPNPAPGGTTSCVGPADAGAATFQPGAGGAGGAGAICTMQDTCSQHIGTFNVVTACCTGTPGLGSAGTGVAPTAGTNGQNGVAKLSATGYLVGDGLSGTSGAPGQGGMGGAGINPFFVDGSSHQAGGFVGQGVGGAGGGSGGCPGLAGTFGSGGGASIAIITDSVFTLDTCVVRSGNGGKAGQGTFGSSPTSGGSAGTIIPTSGPASAGTAGSASGWSGNGSAGPSFGIAAHGSLPTLKSTVPQVGNGGKGILVRTQNSKTIPATPDGASAATFTF